VQVSARLVEQQPGSELVLKPVAVLLAGTYSKSASMSKVSSDVLKEGIAGEFGAARHMRAGHCCCDGLACYQAARLDLVEESSSWATTKQHQHAQQ
jgi:hypothetical protein